MPLCDLYRWCGAARSVETESTLGTVGKLARPVGGQALVEYALILALIAFVASIALFGLGEQVTGVIGQVSSRLGGQEECQGRRCGPKPGNPDPGPPDAPKPGNPDPGPPSDSKPGNPKPKGMGPSMKMRVASGYDNPALLHNLDYRKLTA